MFYSKHCGLIVRVAHNQVYKDTASGLSRLGSEIAPVSSKGISLDRYDSGGEGAGGLA